MLAKDRLGDPAFAPRALRRGLVVASGAAVAAFLIGGLIYMGINSSCTNFHNCTDSLCAPCRRVTFALGTHTVVQPVLAGMTAGFLGYANRSENTAKLTLATWAVIAGLVFAVCLRGAGSW